MRRTVADSGSTPDTSTSSEGAVLIAAIAEDGTIGHKGTLPWHIPEDLAHFRATTLGRTILMGRRTFDAIGRALPGRVNLVLTRRVGWRPAGVVTVASLDEALARDPTLAVIGGAELYVRALPYVQRLVITRVDLRPDGDTKWALDTSAFALERTLRLTPRATVEWYTRVQRSSASAT